MFTELRPVLEQARELAAEDDDHVFNELGDLRQKPDFELTDANGQRIRKGRYETNVGGHLTRAIRKAGLEYDFDAFIERALNIGSSAVEKLKQDFT